MPQQTQAEAVVVNPIEGMNQFLESLSLKDSEFRLIQGTYPKEMGLQTRMPGKVASKKFASSVLSIFDFFGRRILQTGADGLQYEQEDGTFATLQVAASTQTANKDSFAVSPQIELCVRCNGEERTKVIDVNGHIYNAEIPAPTAQVTLTNVSGGSLPYSTKYVYTTVHAASTSYPLIDTNLAINGQICPRSNPGPMAVTVSTPASGANKTIRVTNGVAPTRADVDEIWIFKTTGHLTNAEAENAAAAGLMYYVGKIPYPFSAVFNDTGANVLVDQIENDNFPASSFNFVTYHEPYFIGFAINKLVAEVTWTTGVSGTGIITLSSGAWWPGRDTQYIKLTGITTNGIDGKGTFRFKYISSASATIYPDDDPTGALVSIPTAGIGVGNFITFSSRVNIYRSQPHNPFAWGWTRVIGVEIESLEWVLKVSGGVGTALAVVPNQSILKVDTEFPTKCLAYNLALIDDFDQIKNSQNTISENFSVSINGSQFAAQTSNRSTVLWGMDFKNFAILQCNGITQNPISFLIQNVLRGLTQNRADQVYCHGIYDPTTQCNCIWVTIGPSTNFSPSRVHYLVYQHAPTGYWGVVEDLDVMCSALAQDRITLQQKVMVGTESGLYGQAFVNGQYKNWIPTGNVLQGSILSNTSTTITAAALSFTVTDGLVGSWVLLTDVNGQHEEWARISAATTAVLTFDRTYSDGIRFATLQTIPTKYNLGLIECRMLKYFDCKKPNIEKRFMEMTMCQEAANSTIRLYREWLPTLWVQFDPIQNTFRDAVGSTMYIDKKQIPQEPMTVVGLEIINRSYVAWTLRNLILKFQPLNK